MQPVFSISTGAANSLDVWRTVYRMNMLKAISITLSADNLLWLKGQAAQSAKGSVSQILDGIVTAARSAGHAEPSSIRSVAGTVELPDDDPDLSGADAYIRTLFAASARQPLMGRERKPKVRTVRAGKAARRG